MPVITKGKKVRCPICGRYTYPTVDHVPPKSRGNKENMDKVYVFPRENQYRSKEVVQGGLKFEFLCEDCNSRVLGSDLDKELTSFYNRVTNSKGDEIVWMGDVSKIIKAIFGHILATSNYSKCVPDMQMKNYIKKNKIPDGVHLYAFYYPYENMFLIRNVVSTVFHKRNNSAINLTKAKIVSCLYFYPLAFIVAPPDFCPFAVDLSELVRSGVNGIHLSKNSFVNPHTKKILPPCWPCEMGDKSKDDSIDALVCGFEAKESCVAKIRKG